VHDLQRLDAALGLVAAVRAVPEPDPLDVSAPRGEGDEDFAVDRRQLPQRQLTGVCADRRDLLAQPRRQDLVEFRQRGDRRLLDA